ncbi:DUF6029 family protein [bacterium]|nr:DUF6029 family protein [bacterium]
MLILGAVLIGKLYAQENQFSYTGKSYLEAGYDETEHSESVENWTDLNLSLNNISIQLGIEYFQPAKNFNQDTSQSGLNSRSIQYKTKNQSLKVGHFYPEFNSGLVLKANRDIALRRHLNFDGVHYVYKTKLLRWEALSGKPRDRYSSENSFAPVHGINTSFSPFKIWSFGVNGLYTTNVSNETIRWGSFFQKLNFKMGSAKMELALNDTLDLDYARGLFSSLEFGLASFNFLVEIKDYKKFEINNGAPLNQVPIVMREHSFTLMSRTAGDAQPNPEDERGYTTELSYTFPFENEWTILVSHSKAETHEGLAKYLEYYAQSELWGLPKNSNFTVGGGYQDLDIEYKSNAVFSGQLYTPIFGINNLYLKPLFEHQHSTIRFSSKEYYSQIYRLSMSYKDVTFGGGVEREASLKQGKEYNSWWPSVQCDWQVSHKASINVFYGKRKAGKDCSGGVCITKPEFSGIETLVNYTF